jgi:hypothetical protein
MFDVILSFAISILSLILSAPGCRYPSILSPADGFFCRRCRRFEQFQIRFVARLLHVSAFNRFHYNAARLVFVPAIVEAASSM